MKGCIRFCTVLFLLVCGFAASANVGLEVTLNRRVYMQYERILACVTMRNNTGRPLLFGKDPELQGFLMFDIRDISNRLVTKRPNAEISITGLLLQPGEVRRMIFRLDQYYNISERGSYRVHAYVSHNLLKHEFRSKDAFFEISTGRKVWSHTVGLPALEGKKDSKRDERTYSVRELKTNNDASYYLFVENSKNIFCVSRIGQVFGFEKFQAEVDNFSRLHLLLPISSRVFHYLAFDTNGERLESTFWRISDSIPGLFRDVKNGRVRRVGGAPARLGVDFELPSSAGYKTASQLLNENQKNRLPQPKAQRYSGVVDMGQGVMADAPGSRSGE